MLAEGFFMKKETGINSKAQADLITFVFYRICLSICHPNLMLIWPQTLRYFCFCFYFLSWNFQAPFYCTFSFLLFLLLFLQILARLVSSYHSSHSAEGFLTIQLKNVPSSCYAIMILTTL